MNINRAIAFDYGTHHIGIAVGNEQIGTAQGLKAFSGWKDSEENYAQMDAIFKEWQPEYIVVGIPAARFDESHERKNLGINPKKKTPAQDPTTLIANQARKFAHKLMNRYNLPVYFKDERYTSTSAKEEIFQYQGGYRALVKNKGRIDSTAARMILESFFEQGGRSANFEYSLPPKLFNQAKQNLQSKS